MDLNQLVTLAFWNGLVREHLTEIVMILTAAIVVVLDRYIRRAIAEWTGSFHVVSRFLVFLLVCSVGYAALSLGVAWILKTGYVLSKGMYAAPSVLVLLMIIAVEAQRQRQI